MAKHNVKIQKQFISSMEGCAKMGEQEFQDTMNKTIVAVEVDQEYSTSQKLKIYSLMTTLSNCMLKDREKYVRKVSRVL